MPDERPLTRPRVVVNITKDLISDLKAIYASMDERAADRVRDALARTIGQMSRDEMDRSLIEPHGIFGTTFAYNFLPDFLFTFRIETHFDQDRPVEEHYFLKNLNRKKQRVR